MTGEYEYADEYDRTLLEHIADRPSWDCKRCEKPWPCDPAREQMLNDKQTDPTQLRIYLWLHLEEAADQLPTMSFKEAIERFVGWV